MPQPVFARELRSGDSVWSQGLGQFIAFKVNVGVTIVQIIDDIGGSHIVNSGDLFLVVRRPWPEGKTEEDMLVAVEMAMRSCVRAEIENDGRSIGAFVTLLRGKSLGDDLRALREAIEAYELGR